MQQPLVMILYHGIKAFIHSTNFLLLETSWESLLVMFRGKIRKSLDLHEEACALSLGLLLSAMILGLAPQFPLLKAVNAGVLDCSGNCSVSVLTKGLQGPGMLSGRKSLFCICSLDQQISVWVWMQTQKISCVPEQPERAGL